MKGKTWLAVVTATAAFALIIFCVVTITKGTDNRKMKIENFHAEALGENVYLFKESDDHAAIQTVIEEIYERQETNQFGNERYPFAFSRVITATLP